MTPTQRELITKHGENLLAIFPDALDRDPISLCKKLRRLELKGQRHAEQLCGSEWYCNSPQSERTNEAIPASANKLLGTDRVWLNRDPRGYALKVDLMPGEVLHRDWGGYGIIAPEIKP